MINDIIFGGIGDTTGFILETPNIINGQILSYSLDGSNYDLIPSGESISIIIS